MISDRPLIAFVNASRGLHDRFADGGIDAEIGTTCLEAAHRASLDAADPRRALNERDLALY